MNINLAKYHSQHVSYPSKYLLLLFESQSSAIYELCHFNMLNAKPTWIQQGLK